MIPLNIDRVILLLLVAAVVAIAARKIRLPYTVGLLLTGMALAALHAGNGHGLTRDLVFKAFLPPLIFEAALNTSWRQLRGNALTIVLLATLGVLAAAAVVSVAMALLLHWPWPAAIIFGILLSATDPVAVISIFKDAGVEGRFRQVVEAESMLNDGTAATLFVIAFSVFTAHTAFHPAAAALDLLRSVAGGIAVGVLVGFVVTAVSRRTTDHLVEMSLTAVAAYGSFLIADHLGGSGILATVATGLVLGNIQEVRPGAGAWLTDRGREVVLAVWDFAAFTVNSLIFLLIGLRVGTLHGVRSEIMAVAVAGCAMMVGRAAAVYPICGALKSHAAALTLFEQHLLVWGGLRGALALALALSLPSTFPGSASVVVTTFLVVTVSIVVQGTTMPAVLKRLAPKEKEPVLC